MCVPAAYSPRSNVGSSLRILDKKDTLHPPVSYRPLSRTGAISRETSPSSVTSTTTGSYSTRRLYPDTYSRSASRERTESSGASSTLPKYAGRGATNDIIPLSRTRNEPKEDLSPMYRTGSRTASREDLNSGPQKYITSRFLPKNAVEKSYTAYTRASTARANEASRKNRELLNVINAQERIGRPASRCSSSTAQSDSSKFKSTSTEQSGAQEMETVTVVTRGTSPIQSSAAKGARSRRVEVAKEVVTRPKKKVEGVDAEVQSDDAARCSRFARVSAAPWSSFLDMKFSPPGDNQKTVKDEQSEDVSSQTDKTDSSESKSKTSKSSKEGSASPKSISRTNSIKNLSRSFSKLDMKGKDSRSPTPPSPSKKTSSSKKLPPQIPKTETGSKGTASFNKDFRKSVLNMNHDAKTKKSTIRSNSVSSVESGSEAPETTDISENLTSCPSYHKSNSSSKLPQRVSGDNSRRSCTRSPSVETNSSGSSPASGSEDDQNKKTKKRQSLTSSRTSMMVSGDELDKCPKPPLSPRVKGEQKSEADAKSFLMRALAPVTNLFKVRHVDSSDKINWMDSSSESTPDEKPQKKFIKRVESGERAWWMDEDKSEPKSPKITPEEKIIKKTLRHADSGEKPWWLDENAEVPSGVEVYTSESQDDGGGFVYKVRRNDSDDKEWWLDSSEGNEKGETAIQPESLQQYRLRHIDSGERAWWMNSSENIADQEQAKPAYKIGRRESGERAWWMDSGEKDKGSEDEESDGTAPLGDRASPEGLETPRDDEG